MSSDCYQYCTIYHIIQCHDDVGLRKLNDFHNVTADIGITQHDEEEPAALLVHRYDAFSRPAHAGMRSRCN